MYMDHLLTTHSYLTHSYLTLHHNVALHLYMEYSIHT